MPVFCCDNHTNEYIDTKSSGKQWSPLECCQNAYRLQLRTLGKFKVEYFGDSSVSLCAKTYFCDGETSKQVSKGVNIKQNSLTFEKYHEVLKTNTPHYIVNKGFRVKNNSVFSYSQRKKGLNSFYCKRKVLDDQINTIPLDL